MPEGYRHAASIVVLKRAEEEGFEVLLLHKPRKRDAWQLPQGGMEEGENVQQTALRELQEEAGLTDVTVFGVSDRVYQYEFPASFKRFRGDALKGQHISFIFAMTSDNPQIKVDNKEINGHVWVRPRQLGFYIKRDIYLNHVRALVGEAIEQAKKL